MIEAMIFDLDGTLVQTEKLKALSYAQAAVELCPYDITEQEVITAFKDVVGLSRREVATALVERFSLAEKASARMGEFRVATAWQAYVQIRLKKYQRLLSTPEMLLDNQWTHNVDLLNAAREQGCKTALATMSYCEQARYVLEVLKLNDQFDFVATRDDVEQGKPDPEIYLLVSNQIEVKPEGCLVIEDSPAGVEAALEAGMACIAVATPFTQVRLHASQLLEKRWIVDEPGTLLDVVKLKFAEHAA